MVFLSEGQRNEIIGLWPLMESGEVKQRWVVAELGYALLASAPTRATLRGWSGAI